MGDTNACLKFYYRNIVYPQASAETEKQCQIFGAIKPYFDWSLGGSLIFFLFIVTIVSIFGQIKENYRWFVLHYSFTNLLIRLIHLLYMIYVVPSERPEFIKPILALYPYFNHVAITSLLPLTINRFLRLYFPKKYYKIFRPKNIAAFLFIYDLIVVAVVYVMITIKQNSLMEIVIMMPLMIISIIFSLLIFEKICRMKNLAVESSTTSSGENNNSLSDIRRAAIVCVVQPLGFIIYNILIFIGESIYIQISTLPAIDVPDSSVKSYLIISTFYPFVYLTAMLVDTCLLLFSLKTYRRGAILIWNNILNKETPAHSTGGQHTFFTKTGQTRNQNTFVTSHSQMPTVIT